MRLGGAFICSSFSGCNARTPIYTVLLKSAASFLTRIIQRGNRSVSSFEKSAYLTLLRVVFLDFLKRTAAA